jgi:hypothetical protein
MIFTTVGLGAGLHFFSECHRTILTSYSILIRNNAVDTKDRIKLAVRYPFVQYQWLTVADLCV